MTRAVGDTVFKGVSPAGTAPEDCLYDAEVVEFYEMRGATGLTCARDTSETPPIAAETLQTE